MYAEKPNLFAARPTQVRWLIFVLIGATSWLLYLHRYAWGVIKPAFRAENPNLTDTQIGWLDSAFLATYAFGQVPGGLAGDLVGPRLVLGVSILLWSLTVAALAWTTGFWPLFGVRSAFGLGQAGVYPVMSQVTRHWFPVTIRTSVQGTVAALGRVGGACAPPIVAALLMYHLGLSWQASLVAIGLPGVLLAVAFWIVFRNSPQTHPWTNAAEQEVIEGPRPAFHLEGGEKRPAPATPESADITAAPSPSIAMRPTDPPQTGRWSFEGLSGSSGGAAMSVVMLLAYSFFSTFADMLYVFWIPSFLVDGKGLSTAEMGWFAPLPLLGGAAGGVVGGMLNDLLLHRTTRPRWARSGVALSGKSLAAVLIVASLAVSDGRLVMLLLLGCKFFGDWSLPTQWGTITDMAGKGAGTVFGIVNTVGSIGGFVAGPVLGYLKQNHGWDGLFLGVGVAYLLAALCWLFIDCTRRIV
jgi:sugar phosphate permease